MHCIFGYNIKIHNFRFFLSYGYNKQVCHIVWQGNHGNVHIMQNTYSNICKEVNKKGHSLMKSKHDSGSKPLAFVDLPGLHPVNSDDIIFQLRIVEIFCSRLNYIMKE